MLNSNPLDDIRNTIDAQHVMKGGKLYDAMTLDEFWPNVVPSGPYYWINEDMLKTDPIPTNVFDGTGRTGRRSGGREGRAWGPKIRCRPRLGEEGR